MSSQAHANERIRKKYGPVGLFLGIALVAVVAGMARAAALGELELRSYLGEHFDARIPISAGEGESMDLACFSLAAPEADGPSITRAQLAVEGEGTQARLRIQSNRPWNEPVANVRVRFFCARTGPVIREYALLIDPRGAVSPPVRQAIVAQRVSATPSASLANSPPAAPPSPGGRLRAVTGDTLASIAKAVYPRGRKVQEAFIAAMRAETPPLAALPENDPIAEGTEVSLPDLRDFANTAKVVEAVRLADAAPATPAPAKATAAAAPTPSKPRAAPEKKSSSVPPPAAKPSTAAPTPKPEPKPLRPPAVSPRAEGTFQLRLSTGDIDMARSRGMDDEKRGRLRERQLVLDSDDQVAALLALRHSLKQLETRVAELQLRLTTSTPAISAPVAVATIPPAPAPRTPAPAPAKPVEASKPIEAAKPAAAPAPTPAPTPAPRLAEPAPPPGAEPAPSPAPAAKVPEKAIKPVESKPEATAESGSDDLPAWLWGVVALLILAIGWLIWRLLRSRSTDTDHEVEPEGGPVSDLGMADSATKVVDGEVVDQPAEPNPERRPARVGEMTMQVAAYRPAPQMESDASLTTQVQMGDPNDLRRRYIEERFPELANRTISLEDSDSIVKGARLFHEDGAHSRAIELLTFSIEERPGSVKLWLALFEIYRLGGMTAEFADLAGRFRSTHENSEYWRKIQFIGREIDPQHPLYLDSAPHNSLETIGYTASRSRDPRSSEFDPLAENWLNAPMDFMTDALASDLRRAVMAEHGVSDADIAPNPMPALKNVEVFGGS